MFTVYLYFSNPRWVDTSEEEATPHNRLILAAWNIHTVRQVNWSAYETVTLFYSFSFATGFLFSGFYKHFYFQSKRARKQLSRRSLFRNDSATVNVKDAQVNTTLRIRKLATTKQVSVLPDQQLWFQRTLTQHIITLYGVYVPENLGER
jgi:hypothetical protein